MKKFTVFALFLFCTISMFAQEEIGTYHSSYFDKDLEVLAVSPEEKNSIYISVCGEHSIDDVVINVEGYAIEEFRSALSQAKSKFAEWAKIAKDNNVKDMTKDMDITFPKVTIAWHSSKWWFSFRQSLKPRFIVTSEGKCAFVIAGKAVSSSNEYIDQRYYFALSDVRDFDELLNVTSKEYIASKFTKKQNVEDLFK